MKTGSINGWSAASHYLVTNRSSASLGLNIQFTEFEHFPFTYYD